jgi:predicted PurR-regulated permease PerM
MTMSQSTQHAWFLILLGLVTLAFFWLTLDFVQPLFWAAVMAILFHPLQRRVEAAVGGKGRAAIVTTTAIVMLVFVPLTLIGVAVSREALSVYARIKAGDIDVPGFVARLEPVARDLAARLGIDPASIQTGAVDAAGTAAQLIASQAVVVGQNVFSAVAQTALMIYLLFFFLRDGEKVLEGVARAIPMGQARERALFARFSSVTRATLKGTLVVGAVQGALGGLLFWALGIRAPVFWGVVMTMMSLLPLVGPAIVWLPAAIILLATGSVTAGVILLIGGTLIVGTADNILRPILVGRETRMPDYLVLLSTLGGLTVFGLSGFVAGPVVAALFLTAWDMFALEYEPVDELPAPSSSAGPADPGSP